MKIKKIVKVILRTIYGNKKYNKFIIITRSRTGSNHLVSSLDSHPDILCYGERFRNLNGKSIKFVWDDIFGKSIRKIAYIGFKLMYYHPLDSGSRELWDFIQNDKEIKIIHLKRKNMLRTIISRKIAAQTGVWKQNDNNGISIDNRKISLNKTECFEEFNKIKNWEKEADELFLNHEMISITYEDLNVNKEMILKRVLEFLKLDYVPLKSNLKKQNKESIESLLSNYNEVYNFLINTKWAYLLELDN